MTGVHVKVAGAWQEIGVSGSGGVPWAKVTGGTVTTVNNPDGSVDSVHTFTANGTLTVESPGYAEVLLVSGGGGGYPALGTVPGVGGYVLDGIRALPAGAQAVVVGAGGVAANDQTNQGAASSLGSLKSGRTGPGVGTAGPDPLLTNSNNDPYLTTITGSSLAVSGNKGFGSTVYGGGANNPTDSGQAGVVIVRVQTTPPTVSGVVASGGTESTYVGDGVNGVLGQSYKVHTFTANGSLVVTQAGMADILVVAGGGGGYDAAQAGGGGAGGMLQYRLEISATSYAAMVGNGGVVGGAGAESSFGSLIRCMGGGRGDDARGMAGGSGGGGQEAGAGVPGQGNNAQGGQVSNGGGGAGGPASGANPGPGRVSNISGANVTYALGGNGGAGGATVGYGNGGGRNIPGNKGVVIVRYEIA